MGNNGNIMTFKEYMSSRWLRMEECDAVRVEMGSYTFAWLPEGAKDFEELVETDGRITGKIPSHFRGDGSVEIRWDIDIATGRIRGWDSGEAMIYFKIVDMGIYTLMYGNRPVSRVKGEYVPEFLQPPVSGVTRYGKCEDYLILEVGRDGGIMNWGRLKRKILPFFKRNGQWCNDGE